MTSSFDAIRRMATHLGNVLTDLKEPLERDTYQWNVRRENLDGITRTLNIVAATPNASLGAEVLAEFDRRVKETHDELAKWCESLLNPDVRRDEDDDDIAW